jgi:hypothetical protein
MASLAAEKALAPTLKAAGYNRSGQTWRATRDGITLVVNFQRWHDSIFVNLGVCIVQLRRSASPRINDCHIYLRLERVCPVEYVERIRSASAEEAPEGFVEAFGQWGLPWLESLTSKTGIQAFLKSQLWNQGLVTTEVWAWAGVERRS